MMWLDFRMLGMNDNQLAEFLIKKAHIGLTQGRVFGPGGEGFQRINVGCPRALLQVALERLKSAVQTIG